ncbi:MAG: TIGR01212 family radical SAM protein [Helicobacteraceae bacterium]|jgi:radical SAM protein (TIGR01212 family)|nr:TIGR01212 family radical SAM protein [Helicobacteraceae bacterium]
MRALNTFGRHLRERFGFSVRKIPLSISGFTCPNIDGTAGRGGCDYCANESFSPNLAYARREPITDLKRQYHSSAMLFAKRGIRHFIAYFQSYSNTYAPVDTLRQLHNCALKQKNCVGISIGTRADCIDDEALEYLRDLNSRTYLWVEIGVQSAHDQTLQSINRRETFETIAAVIAKLKQRSVLVCAHLIFGLPNETDEMILSTIDRVGALGIDAVKIHPLYIVKNTRLARSDFVPITLERYLELLVSAIDRLPREMIYQRISAGVDNESLIAPSWCKRKNVLMSSIRKRLLEHSIVY